MEMAAQYCHEHGIDDVASVQRHRLVESLVSMQLLADGCPGEWGAVDVPAFFARLTGCTVFERDGMALAFVGLYTWLGMSARVSPAVVARRLRQTRRHLGDLVLSREFLAVSLACLQSVSPIGGGGSSPSRHANTTVVPSQKPSPPQ
jgi:hypothetical protein